VFGDADEECVLLVMLAGEAGDVAVFFHGLGWLGVTRCDSPVVECAE
jgi:hypothetical protein